MLSLVQGFPRFSPKKLYMVGQTTRAAPEITVAAVQDLPDAVEKTSIHRVFGEAASISRESSKKRMWIWIKPKKKTPVDLSFPGLILTEIYRKDGSKQPDKVHQKNSWTHATNTAAFAQGDVYTYPSL